MQLNLTKPIVFFDLETTGTNVSADRIVEIAALKIHPDGKEEMRTQRINPDMPIPPRVSKIHGITDEDIKDAPKFEEVAHEWARFFKGCDIGGYNSNKFDIPLLAEEFLRVEVDIDLKKHRFIDVQVIFHKMEQRTLSAAYRFYCDKELKGAHGAASDTQATYEVLKAQLDRYNNTLKNDIDYLSKFSSHKRTADFAGRIVFNSDGDEVFNFGKYKGQRVADVLKKDTGYYGWIMNNDFPRYTKRVLTEIKLRSAFNTKT